MLGILGYALIAIAGYFEAREEKNERRAEIRKEFKCEINDLRADDGVYFEEYEREAM